jgi:integrase
VRHRYPKYTHGFIDHDDTPRFYLRVPGRKRVPLPGLPWSPEFMEARERALKEDWTAPEIGVSRTKPGTVNAALVSYYQSTAFSAKIATSTQKNRRAILECFREEHGDKRIALLHRKALQAILNKKSPAAAKNWKKALRGFVDHCISMEMLPHDPLAGLKIVPVKSHGHHPWQPEECQQFETFHKIGTRARLAYALLLQAGQSKCDVVRMGRQHIRNNLMSMPRKKTGVPFNIEIMPELQQAIDAMPASDHLTFLVTAQGKPFTAAGFGNYFRALCNQAGLPKRCTSHGLRAAAATYFAEKGLPITSLWRGSAGPRFRRRRSTPRALTDSSWHRAPRSSFQEQELANRETNLPKRSLSH